MNTEVQTMKRIISLILAVVMIFSVTATGVFAADETQKPVTITFIYDDADVKGLGVEKTKVIYVDFGEDYNSQVPEGVYYSTVDGVRYKFYTDTWTTTANAYNTKLYEKGYFPAITALDNITEITFKADMAVEEVTAENVVGGVIEGVVGEETVDLFKSFVELVKLWFGKLMLYLRNFM